MRASILAAVLVLLFGVRSAGDGTSAIIVGDRVTSRLSEAGVDELELYVPSASLLDVKASSAAGLELALGLLGPDGFAIDVSAYTKGSPGEKAQIKALPIRTPGTYRVRVAADVGSGDYVIQARLRPRKAQNLDIRFGPAEPTAFRVAAASVTFDPAGTTLGATDVQAAGAELHSRVVAMEQSISLAGLPGLRVAGRATSGLSFNSQAVTIVTPSTYSFPASVVKRAQVATATFAPGSVRGPILAFVSWSVHPNTQFNLPSYDVSTRVIWAEVAGKRVSGRPIAGGAEFLDNIPGPNDDNVGFYDALGLGPIPTQVNIVKTYLITYTPTDAERAAGFTFDVLLSTSQPPSAEVPSYRIDIEAAAIFAD